MKITAITKFKHGSLWAAIKQLGWSQSELARQCDTTPTAIGLIMNMLSRPTEKEANKIQIVLAENGIYFDPTQEWPETFQGMKKRITIEQTKDVTALELEAAHIFYDQLTIPQFTENEDAIDVIMEAMSCLGDRERDILQMHYGIEGDPKTLRECGKTWGVSRDRCRQIEGTALTKLRINRIINQKK